MRAVIETTGLRKEFRSRRGTRVAVDGLDLRVAAGGVHGFLGPNGSGKTTTIRMLLGLASATSGGMRLLGQEIPSGLPEVLPRVGAVVESPKFSPNLSGRRNLRLLAGIAGADEDAVTSSLGRVGLADRADDAYKSYSLGMKQRLAIAATLLKSPDLLILDEPTNGLDPAGIREIRELIRDLAATGVTVLLSSHILAEVQQVCDSVTIIGNGRMLASGRVEDLLHSGGRLRVVVDDPGRAREVLHESGVDAAVEPGGGLTVDTDRPAAEVTRLLGEHGLWLSEISPVHVDLEAVFLELTAGTGLGSAIDAGGHR